MFESGQYQRTRTGRTGYLPDWVKRKPSRIHGTDCLLRAYYRLCTERPYCERHVLPIPWGKIDDYALRYGFRLLMREWFVDVMIALDHDYRDHVVEEERKRASKARREAHKKQRLLEAQPGGGQQQRAGEVW